MSHPLVADLTGRPQTWLWLVQTFGPIAYHPARPRRRRPIYRITRLQAGVTGALLSARVLDEEGCPLPRARVVRVWTEPPEEAWPGAPAGSGALPHLRQCAPDALPREGPLADAIALADRQGLVEFPTGPGDDYRLPACGRSTLWVADHGVPSDAVEGIGILRRAAGPRLCLQITWKRIAPPVSPGARHLPRGHPGATHPTGGSHLAACCLAR
jgi:hypothetical protein